MAALEVMQGLLINGTRPPRTDPAVHLSAPSTTPSVPAVSQSGAASGTAASTETPQKSESIKRIYNDYRSIFGWCTALVLGFAFV